MALDTPTASGPPAAYFPSPDDAIVVGIVDIGEYQQRDYDTGDLKTWPDGGPVMGKVITGLVVSTEGGTEAGNSKGSEPVAPGDLVTFWAEGGKHYTYRDALKEAGEVDVGWVMRWARAADEPAKSTRHNDRKVYVAKIRRPEDRDGDLVARCQTAHDELRRGSRLDAAPVADDARTAAAFADEF
jgi:hypothetical protein